MPPVVIPLDNTIAGWIYYAKNRRAQVCIDTVYIFKAYLKLTFISPESNF